MERLVSDENMTRLQADQIIDLLQGILSELKDVDREMRGGLDAIRDEAAKSNRHLICIESNTSRLSVARACVVSSTLPDLKQPHREVSEREKEPDVGSRIWHCFPCTKQDIGEYHCAHFSENMHQCLACALSYEGENATHDQSALLAE